MFLRKHGFMTTSWTLVSASWANMLHAVDGGKPELGSTQWNAAVVHERCPPTGGVYYCNVSALLSTEGI